MPQTPRRVRRPRLLLSGLRIGEICALKWQDVDFQRHILSINKELSPEAWGSYIKGTKTDSACVKSR